MNGYWPRTIGAFPWLTDDLINQIHKKTEHLSGAMKSQAEQEIYRYLLPKVVAKKRNEDRKQAKNEYYSKLINSDNSEERQLWEIKLRQEDLADMVKEQFWLRFNLSTDETMSGFQKYMEWEGVDQKLLTDYLNGNNEELLYKLWFKKKTFNTWRDEQKDGAFWPLVRGVSGLRGGAKGAVSDTAEHLSEIPWRISKVASDDEKNFIEKFNQILFGEIVANWVGGTAGSFIGWWLSGLIKWFTTEREKKSVSKNIQNMVRKVAKSENGQALIQAYNELPKEDREEFNDLLTYANGLMDLAGMKAFKQPAEQGVKALATEGLSILGEVDNLAQASAKSVAKTLAEKSAQKSAESLDKNTAKALETVGRIVQGDEEAKNIALEVFKNLDTKGVKTYKELYERLGARGKELMQQVDDELLKDTKGYNFWDNLVKKEVETVGGTKKIIETPISDGIEQLKELYEKVGDQISFAKMEGLEDKFAKEGLSLKEMNDLARQYSSEFWKKAFNKMGDPKTSVSSELYESQRKAIKEFVREKMPDDVVKNLDKQYSELSNTRAWIEKMAEKVNTLTQKTKKKGFLEKAWGLVANVIDKASGWSLKGFIGKLLPSNVGNKINNSLDMEAELPKLLKEMQGFVWEIKKWSDGAKNQIAQYTENLDKLIKQWNLKVSNANYQNPYKQTLQMLSEVNAQVPKGSPTKDMFTKQVYKQKEEILSKVIEDIDNKTIKGKYNRYFDPNKPKEPSIWVTIWGKVFKYHMPKYLKITPKDNKLPISPSWIMKNWKK